MATSSQLTKQIQDFNKKRKSSAALVAEGEAKYKLPEVQQRVDRLRGLTSNLEQSIEQVDPQVTGRTSGSLVTEAQRGALVNRERAPLLTDYSKVSRDLGGAQEAFTSAQGLASQYAGTMERENDTQYNRLKDLLGAATAAEQAAEAKRQWEATMREQRRQFDAQQAEARRAAAASASGYGFGGGGGGGGGGNGLMPGMSYKNGKDGRSGFALVANGKPVSAAGYAKAKGVSVGDVLSTMAQAGDTTAANAYKWIRSIQGTDMWKSGRWKNTPAYRNFSSLFWGV